MHIEEIINKFQDAKLIGDKSYQCKCPTHADKKASLTITEKDNKILLHCHAGCDSLDILNAVGLKQKDLFNEIPQQKSKIVAEYIYRDEEGKILYKVCRYEPKSFIQARYNGGNWIFKMTGVRYVLYNLPNVIKSDEIYFVEGEKDADNLNSIGLVATTTAGGASGFNKRAKEYVKNLKGKMVYIIPDNDNPGYEYAKNIETALNGVAKGVKILKLADAIDNFPEKSDISDVLRKYGKDRTLEILEELKKNTIKDTIEVTEISNDFNFTPESIFSTETFEALYKYELNRDMNNFFKYYGAIKEFCRQKKITGFDRNYKLFKETQSVKEAETENTMFFPDVNEIVYNTGKYEFAENGAIYEEIPNIGKILVCYQPVFPIEKFINMETGTEKVKLEFYQDETWNNITVDKSIISSTQSIIRLSDYGISVTSENAKQLIKFLADFENRNKDKIPKKTSVSRLGWFGDILIPYSDKIEFDSAKTIPNIDKKFGQKGKLEDWVSFFKERRKQNTITRITMASAVASILLKGIKQNGFTLHIYGETGYGKTVVCMAAQSIFGNPAQESSDGMGINFNFTSAGLESRLNLYNNIPLFINEMQHQKDVRDYDKILFLVSEGKGRTRSNKNVGIAKEYSWNNIVITNGEKNIIKDSSNAGAYNRCLSCEITEHSFEDLSNVADFVKENYGTPIRKILEELPQIDYVSLYKNFIKNVSDEDITGKQKILCALILTGDKILTDVIFQDGYYLTQEDIKAKMIKSSEVVIEERAYELILDWIASERRHFLNIDIDENAIDTIKTDIYGKKISESYIAIIPSVLKKTLQENGYDGNEVLKAWKRKGIIDCEKNRCTKSIRLGEMRTKCVVLETTHFSDEESPEDIDDLEELPF